jgi:hypothetical protein
MFISVKEAMELTGMSSTSIYRLCNKRINTLYIRKEDNKFLIDKDFILAAYPPDIVKVIENTDNETNPVVNEPVFEVVQTTNSEISMPFVLEEEPVKVEENNAIKEIPAHDEEIKLVSLSQKAQIEANVIDKKDNSINNSVVSSLKEKADSEIVKPLPIFNLETLIGISASLIIIGIIIFLIYLEVKK